jgi:hypothetical protein
MSLYELAILGAASPAERVQLVATLSAMLGEFGLTVGIDVAIHDSSSIGARDNHAAFAAAYFCGTESPDLGPVSDLLRANAPIIPSIGPTDDFTGVVPTSLRALNGLRRRHNDDAMTELASAMLECCGLLRRQRRVFVSYRRLESRAAAVQLHDVLSARGFDVFVDTHDIRPGDPFQEVLWHRLVDSDVLVMLDTPGYFDSRWTRQEIGRARAKDIQVLRVIWPAHTPSSLTDLSETLYLDEGDLLGADGPVTDKVADQVALRVERLRSRGIAARSMAITGKLRSDVEKIGGRIEGIGANRAISVRLLDDRHFLAYPVVGVPTAETLHDVTEKARRVDSKGTPIVVYDHLGLRESWIAHLRWLDENISTVRAIRASDAAWILAGWEE